MNPQTLLSKPLSVGRTSLIILDRDNPPFQHRLCISPAVQLTAQAVYKTQFFPTRLFSSFQKSTLCHYACLGYILISDPFHMRCMDTAGNTHVLFIGVSWSLLLPHSARPYHGGEFHLCHKFCHHKRTNRDSAGKAVLLGGHSGLGLRWSPQE